MEIALREVRKSYGLTKAAFAEIIGITELFYSQYEQKNELPSKYVYLLWKSLEDFPIPEDFFFYTSFTLEINMKYHHMTQKQVAELFDIANQSTISGYLRNNIPMYEKKEYFWKFEPFILPSILVSEKDGYATKEITDLQAKGNFILVEKRRLQKISRLDRESKKSNEQKKKVI
ncbi:HTH domain-containing protein (plasmid) [Butyrivibrio proteoclasticus B316]|uniref:HTH domain-containing protein n=1 Tax=Butyrivibrio proteoclasticus (strain ATCC 51982 / DSM 14932 / B316) TaxID=515622 RepID=E0S4W1_BUTPB|nr:transcriptional regulator [Butyrivibrio proteoclasticus]ADL36443.1 HTH domain-containing protein [Butyrivibrio proteoclasticus B316]